MKLHRALGLLVLLALVPSISSCRAIQINKLEERVDNLESRTAALEAQMAILMKK